MNIHVRFEIQKLRKSILESNLIDISQLTEVESKHLLNWQLNPNCKTRNNVKESKRNGIAAVLLATICLLLYGAMNINVVEYLLSIRCFIPNNYLIYEATRPISNCKFCANVKSPLILPNISSPSEFAQYAYLAEPIIIKRAFSFWPARKELTFQYLRNLYNKYPDALNRFNDECQFLPFKTSFKELREFFDMSEAQVKSARPPWYVGFSNCNANILNQLRRLYPRPHFLPKDSEIPNTDYVFLGYDEGAVMHLDYIPRLMWQAQLQGNKTWIVSPPPECDSICSSFKFYVESGDALLIDTRVWYHSTRVAGQFSMTVQSEYG